MKTIPIKQAQAFAIANALQQVIIFGHDGSTTHVVTWGDTPEHSTSAAAGANHIKKQWNWPADTIVESEKVQALQRRLEAAEVLIGQLQSQLAGPTSVHVIEGTEYERGWGRRPDGYVAFMSKDAAEMYIANYIERNHPVGSSVPDEYTVYEYIGLKECSQAFAKLVRQKGQHHFNRKSEMLE